MVNEVLETLVTKWNDENKCGKCWKLVKTFNDHVKGVTNLYTPKDNCCTHIFLEGLRTKTIKKFNDDFDTIEQKYCEYYLHLKIAEVSNFQKSKADEHGCNDNIYNKHIKPIIDCLSCDFEKDTCSLLPNNSVTFRNEETEPFFSFGDVNWAGLDYKVTVRIY